MLFAVATPTAMMAPISEGTLSVVCVSEQHPQNARERARQRRQNDKRIQPGLEVDHHQQIDQQDREHHAEAETAERGSWFPPARARDDGGPRQMSLRFVQNLLDVAGDSAQIALVGIGETSNTG